jgi:hypothetical protein
MNVMLAANGYLQTVIPVERGSDYMGALEATSVRQEIKRIEELIGLPLFIDCRATRCLDGGRCAVL